MEFWGVEVKGGEALKVKPKEDCLIHISQAALGESKKDKSNEPVPLFVKFDNKKLVLGTLISDNIPQLSFDLVFEKEFELSHNWKHGSIYFCGYQTPLPDEDDFVGATDLSDFGEPEDEELPLVMAENGKVELKAEDAKPPTAKATAGKPEASVKPKAKLAEPSKDNKSEDESDDSDESDDESDDGEGSEDEDGESEEGMSMDDDDDDDEEDDESDEEETPKKAESGKKRPNDSATKTPVPSKKAKATTPQKTDGKKGGHTATPHPAKNAGKAAANAKPQTPKSGGQFSCNSCDRSFGSDAALQSHTKAKHSGK